MDKKKKYDSILFDLDGTLTDSGPGIMRCVRTVLDHYGIPVDHPDDLRVFVGPPLVKTFFEWGVPKDEGDNALALYRKDYNVTGLFENSVYEGVEDMLRRLKQEGFRLFVATSKPENTARTVLEHFGLDGYFEYIGGAGMDETRLTKEEVIEYILSRKNIGRAVMAGDTEYDVTGAKKFGIETIGVSWGYGQKEAMIKAGAVYMIDSPEEIYSLIYE